MQKHLIAMTSITYAMKARALLAGMGMYCEVVRTPKNTGTGCGYSIAVRDDPKEIASILNSHKIPHKGVIGRI
ncbi:MAG: DUF3343 domain-containing protein [Ruminococcus sp.]|nr:DUF3343 domain-containing protein [Ruminococcus sp.]